MEGKDFRLAKEIKYIQRQAAEHDGRFVTIGPLVSFSTETGDAWNWTPHVNLLPDSPAMGIQNPSTSRKPTLATPSAGKVTTALRAAPSSRSTESPAGSSRSLAILPPPLPSQRGAKPDQSILQLLINRTLVLPAEQSHVIRDSQPQPAANRHP
jgi:hypothetical protein